MKNSAQPQAPQAIKPRTGRNGAKPRTLHDIKRTAEPYIWLLPSIIMMGVMILVPIISVFQTSFSEIS